MSHLNLDLKVVVEEGDSAPRFLEMPLEAGDGLWLLLSCGCVIRKEPRLPNKDLTQKIRSRLFM